MSEIDCENNCCSISNCDIFDFMTKHVGLTVIHPGGLKATRRLLDCLDIDADSKVIDIACGKGTTALYIAERYGCEVMGVDISAELIEVANRLRKRKKLENKVIFKTGDAMHLPFSDNTFDVAVSQAMLILVKDKITTIRETDRVLKTGGRAGWLELSWRKKINRDFLDKVSDVLCAYCMTNVDTYDEWRTIFGKAGIDSVSILESKNFRGGFFDGLKDEGIINTVRIMWNALKNKEIKKRMKIMNAFFKEHKDYFGYGIYYYQKK